MALAVSGKVLTRCAVVFYNLCAKPRRTHWAARQASRSQVASLSGLASELVLEDPGDLVLRERVDELDVAPHGEAEQELGAVADEVSGVDLATRASA